MITPKVLDEVMNVNFGAFIALVRNITTKKHCNEGLSIVGISSISSQRGGASVTAYAASKAAADLLAQSYFRTYRFPVTISRCSNNYGPYQHLEKLIPAMIIRAQNNEKLPIYGKGINIRDWLHVYDHCTALDLILDHGKTGEVYKIGGNNKRTNQNVVNELYTTNWFDISYELSYQDDTFTEMSEGKQAFVILKLLLDFSTKKCPIPIDQT